MASMSVGPPKKRVRVDLPVARVQDDAQRRADGYPVGLWDRVGERDQLHLERSEGELAAKGDLCQRHIVEDAGVAQLLAQQEGGEGGGVAGRLQPGPEPAHRADVILMRVGQDDAEDVVGMLFDEARVGHDDLDARRGRVAESHAEIDHDPLPRMGRTVAVEIEVHPDLVRPAEGEEHEFVAGGWLGHGRQRRHALFLR